MTTDPLVLMSYAALLIAAALLLDLVVLTCYARGIFSERVTLLGRLAAMTTGAVALALLIGAVDVR